MIPELGHFALILALAVAVVQGSLPAIGAARQSDSLMAVAGPAAVAQFLLVGTAFLSLMYAYVVSDFTVRSEEHTSELQSLMRISYAVFCLKTKNRHK